MDEVQGLYKGHTHTRNLVVLVKIPALIVFVARRLPIWPLASNDPCVCHGCSDPFLVAFTLTLVTVLNGQPFSWGGMFA